MQYNNAQNVVPGCGMMLLFHLILLLVDPLWSTNTTPLTEQGTQGQQNTHKRTLGWRTLAKWLRHFTVHLQSFQLLNSTDCSRLKYPYWCITFPPFLHRTLVHLGLAVLPLLIQTSLQVRVTHTRPGDMSWSARLKPRHQLMTFCWTFLKSTLLWISCEEENCLGWEHWIS